MSLRNITPATPDVADDPRIDPAVRQFLIEINKDPLPFWEQPQPKPQQVVEALQAQTPVDMSGVVISRRELDADGRRVPLYVMQPEKPAANPGVILFLHGAVWIAGNFENHKRLLRDIVVACGQPAVFLESTNLPEGKYPVPVEQAYAALEWTAKNAHAVGADPRRIAVVGNSVGGNMAAALALLNKDRKGPPLSLQVLLWPAVDASVDSDSYLEFADGRFLSREFMRFGWERYAPTRALQDNPYVSPLRATAEQLKGLPPALVITDENDVLRDEGEAYAHKLQNAGVPTIAMRYNGTVHDFGLLNALSRAADHAGDDSPSGRHHQALYRRLKLKPAQPRSLRVAPAGSRSQVRRYGA